MAGRTVCVLVIGMALLGVATAFPKFFPSQVESDVDCTAHPQKNYGAHQAPVMEESLTITVSSDDEEVTAFCPGEEYDVELSFDTPILGMMTTTGGEFVDGAEDCPQRANLIKPGSVTQTATWTAGCEKDKEEATVMVTCATGPTGAYMQKKATIPIGEDCKTKCT